MVRVRFFCNLAVLVVAIVLIVASAGFAPGGIEWLGMTCGIAGLAFSASYWALVTHERSWLGSRDFRILGRTVVLWRALSGAIATFATWEIVVAVIFAVSVSRWLSLANGIVIAILAIGALVVHEHTSERVVHVLEVVDRPPAEGW